MFGDGSVKAQLNWQRINDSLFQVTEFLGHSLDYLGDLLTAWYVDSPGSNRAKPAKAERQARIAEFEKAFTAYRESVQLILPGYEIGSHATLILDGTHRAVAAYRHRVPVRLFVFSLCGPVNEGLLPDLRHYL